MQTLALYVLASCAEIAGCFSFWAWLRLGHTPLWLVPGGGCLVLFAWLLTLSQADHAGRAYALYGGVYIITSFLWGWWVEGVRPVPSDGLGVLLCLLGAGVMLYGPRLS
ncbi:YnfA family protein [Saccharibacter floricola]|uniref:Uncharacterized protein n=1 Tax=Saccharibacter floricola DSM 15669 TaxID=1123227 RepID=A0ABQ0NYL4_9PROT|nr:YnfA family protein [Saccharibacter floricola]GBQ06670.1 hypothetical protein AA15669_1038 [Saccharibacter floricola DSM 15669]